MHGCGVGLGVGLIVGLAVGDGVGACVGAGVGTGVGAGVGAVVGAAVGALVGLDVGTEVGTGVGAGVGLAVTAMHLEHLLSAQWYPRLGGIALVHTRPESKPQPVWLVVFCCTAVAEQSAAPRPWQARTACAYVL